MEWFQIRKGVCQGCILSPCLFKFYAKYIMQNDRLDEAQVGIKFARRNSNNLKYGNSTLMEEKEEVLKSLLRVKEEWKSWFTAQHSRKLWSWYSVPSFHGK